MHSKMWEIGATRLIMPGRKWVADELISVKGYDWQRHRLKDFAIVIEFYQMNEKKTIDYKGNGEFLPTAC